MPGAYKISVYNKDGSEELLASTWGDFGIIVQSDRLLWNGTDMADYNYVLFSNTNVIGYATTQNATVAEYPIGAEYVPEFGTTLTLYEVERDPYNITFSKNQLIIKCKDKTMEKDLQISFEGGGEPTWEDVINADVPTIFEGGYAYIARNGIDSYYTSSVSGKTGIWHKNLQTGETTQIYSNGIYWQFYLEDSKGNVYVSSNDSGYPGIIRISGLTAIQIYSSGYFWKYFFEDSSGNIYFGSEISGTGIVRISGSTATQVYSSGYFWKYFFEDSKGNVYIYGSSSTNSVGLIYSNGETATQVYSTGYNFVFFEDSKGNVYAGSDSSAGIVHLNGSTATQVYNTGSKWTSFIEDNKGNVYCGGSGVSDSGILLLDGSTATQIYSSGNYWGFFYKNVKGNVYVGSDYSDGILKLNEGTVTLIYSSGYRWKYFFEDSSGNVYVSSSSYNGIIRISDSTVTKIYNVGLNWKYLFERDKNNLLITKTDKPKDDSSIVQLINNVATGYIYKEVTK